jgi:hypothetical protein
MLSEAEYWEQVLKDAGLGMSVGQRTDFLSYCGDHLEVVIKYESNGQQFDYTVATKPADGRTSQNARLAAIALWRSLSPEDRILHIQRMRAGLDPVKAARVLWDKAPPETRLRCLVTLANGRTSEAARRRWQNRTPEQKARALLILAEGRKQK